MGERGRVIGGRGREVGNGYPLPTPSLKETAFAFK